MRSVDPTPMGLAVVLGLLGCPSTKDSGTCFVAGTQVATVDGVVPIEAIEVGDVVWSGDGAGALVPRRVVDTISRRVDRVLVVELGDRTIEVTGEHPFYSLSGQGWVDAGDLLPGEALLGLDGAPDRIRSVVEKQGRTRVFNLTVEGPEHTFYAGDVLVHNKTYGGWSSYEPPLTGIAGGTPSLSLAAAWTDDGELPTDTDGDGQADTGCGDAVDIAIVDPLNAQPWDFGLVSSGSWTAEDCLNGYGTLQLCHAVGFSHRLEQVCLSDDVVAGSTTFFDASAEMDLTYYFHEGGDCFVFGADVSYYAGLACTEL